MTAVRQRSGLTFGFATAFLTVVYAVCLLGGLEDELNTVFPAEETI